MKAKLSATTISSIQQDSKPYEIVDTEVKGFLLRIQPTGRKTFYYAYRAKDGYRKRIKIGVLGPALTVTQARTKAIRLAGKVLDGVDVQADKKRGKRLAVEARHRTLEAFVNEHYKQWVLENHKSGKETLALISYSFPALLPLAMSEITVQVMEQWRTKKLQGGLQPATINRAVAALRGVLSRAVEWNIIQEHPFSNLKSLPVDNTPNVRYLTPNEEIRLLTALERRDEELKEARGRGNQHRQTRGYTLLPNLDLCTFADRLTPMVMLSLKTGMRQGELFELTWSDIDFSNHVITIRAEVSKSRRTNHIPLSPTAITVLEAWREQAPQPNGRVFPSDEGGRLNNVHRSWYSLLKKAEIANFRWHDMRHHFASTLVMKGVPLNTVRELCGHSDITTTLRYAHLAPDHKAEAVALLG